MRGLLIVLSCIALFSAPGVVAGEEDQVTKQRQLDEACESAREEKLAPLREKYIEECVEKQLRKENARAYCERFYSDYGSQSGRQPPLFYDLPECIEAFEYRNRGSEDRVTDWLEPRGIGVGFAAAPYAERYEAA